MIVYTTHMIQKSGFTLIELLIVVAIIGILSSIVLITLSDSGDEAENTKIKYELRQIHTAATLYKLEKTPRSFEGFCGHGKIQPIYKSFGYVATCAAGVNTCAIRVSDENNAKIIGNCASKSDGWLVYVQNATGVEEPQSSDDYEKNYWCVDSNGGAPKGRGTAPGGTDYAC